MVKAAKGDPGLNLYLASQQAAGFVLQPHAKVLEIGCAQADWKGLALQAEPTLNYTGIDYERGKGQDVLTVNLPKASFDWVVGISSIEHVGLGHYGDPKAALGDVQAMRRVSEWLTPGGSCYLDVPYAPSGYRIVGGDKCRCYDDQSADKRLIPDGLSLKWIGFARKGDTRTLIPRPTDDDPNKTGFLYYAALWLVKGVGMDSADGTKDARCV